jgi:acyl carrier protein
MARRGKTSGRQSIQDIYASDREFAARVIRVVASQVDKPGVGQVVPEATLKDLGFDSFGAVELMFALEEEFHVEITDEMVGGIKSVEDIIVQLHPLCGANQVPS